MKNETRIAFALECLTDGLPERTPRGAGTKSLRSQDFRTEADRARREARAWAAGAGVQGVGVGPRQVNGRDTPDLALRIYVASKKPKSKVRAPVPTRVVIGGLGAVETDVVEIGRIRPQAFKGKARPVMPGVGVSHPDVLGGTIGCFVRRVGEPQLYVLSNAHVIGDDGIAEIGDPILQPAVIDGGRRGPETIGHLEYIQRYGYTSTTYPNVIDAAIARITKTLQTEANIRLLAAAPRGISATIRRDMLVHKVGRTTDRTEARVLDVHFKYKARYKKPGHRSLAMNRPGHRRRGRVGFSQQVLCSRFTEDGDSGALVLNRRHAAVGLHAAGSESVSIFCRMTNVVAAFGIELVRPSELP